MNYALMILKLIPYITAGVSIVHQDATQGQKTQIAQDLLGVATLASQQVLSGTNAELAQAIGSVAHDSVASIIATLHSGSSSTATVSK